MFEVNLPWPPTVNHYWGVRGLRRYLTKRAKDFRQDVIDVCDNSECIYPTQRLSLHLKLFMPDNRRRDIDNVSKGILDSLAYAGCYNDDCQIYQLFIEKVDKTAHGLPNGGVKACIKPV